MPRLTLWIASALIALAGMAAWAAPARAESIAAQGCAFSAPAGTLPAQLFNHPPRTCGAPRDRAGGRLSYVLFRDLDGLAHPADILEFSYRAGRANFQRVYFRYADGAIVQAVERRDAAYRPLADNSLYYAVPARAAPLSAVLVESRGYENAHGAAPRARLDTRTDNLARLADMRLYYGIFAGAIFAMLAYNLMLWSALRYRFIAVYCALGAAMLAFGLSWTGLLQAIVPMRLNTQIAFNFFFYMLVVTIFAAFVVTLLERATVPTWLRRGLVVAAAIGLSASLVRLAGEELAWRLVDFATYVALLALMGLLLVAIALGIRRNDRMLTYFLIAWTVPVAFGLWRTLWGAGIVVSDSVIYDISPLGVMALEMVLSGLGMAARIRMLRIERDDAQAMRAMLEHRADTDSLSGLLNHGAFVERAGARSGDQRLVLIDIDGFKTVNDRFGHEAGDRVVAEIGSLLRTGCPPDGIAGRLGGDEFAVLVDAADGYEQLAERLLLQIAYAPLPIHAKVTASAGHAVGPADNEANWRALYNAADRALYVAKGEGRNRARAGAVTPFA